MKNIAAINLFLVLGFGIIYAQLDLKLDTVLVKQECFGFTSEMSETPFICIKARWTLKNVSDSTLIIDYPAYLRSEEVKPKSEEFKETFSGIGNVILHLTNDSTSFKENNCCIEAPSIELHLRQLKPNEVIKGELSGRYFNLNNGSYDLQLEYTTEFQKNTKSYWRGTLFSNQINLIVHK